MQVFISSIQYLLYNDELNNFSKRKSIVYIESNDYFQLFVYTICIKILTYTIMHANYALSQYFINEVKLNYEDKRYGLININ